MSLMPCIFHEMTGLYCPGCGGTRAFIMLFTGHPILSFLYNPVVIYATGVLLFYIVWGIAYAAARKRGAKEAPGQVAGSGRFIRRPKFYLAFVWVFLAVLLANCAAKNIALLCFGTDIMPG